jgi:glycosyltransferase involved in cell wall biosynthesis
VIRQTWKDWELLVVDDGSKDDTTEVVESYADERIRLIRQWNQGQAVARNTGLAEAQGELIAFLDHDDRWLPTKLELQVRYLEMHPEAGVVYGRVRHIDERGHDYGIVNGCNAEGWVYRDLLCEHNFLYTMSLPLLRTAQVREVGGLDASTDISDDLDLFLRLAQITQFGYLPELLLEYNVGNPQQQTRDVQRVFRSEWNCIQRYVLSGPRLTSAEDRLIRKSWGTLFAPSFREQGWRALRAADYRTAGRHYAQAIRLSPKLLRDRQVVRDLCGLCRGWLWAGMGSRFGASSQGSK